MLLFKSLTLTRDKKVIQYRKLSECSYSIDIIQTRQQISKTFIQSFGADL